MLPDPSTTLLGFIVNLCAGFTVNGLSNKQLNSELRKEITGWIDSLPMGVAANPESLFRLTPKGERRDDFGPAVLTILRDFNRKRIPSKENWHKALVETWTENRDSMEEGERASLYNLDQVEARELLLRLAEACHDICIDDDILFQRTVIDAVESIEKKTNQIVDELHVVTAGQHASTVQESTNRNEKGGLVAIGPSFFFQGLQVSANGNEWVFRADEILSGDIGGLTDFSSEFRNYKTHEQYVLVNTLGDGRQLESPPSWRIVDGKTQIVLHVEPRFDREDARQFGGTVSTEEFANFKMIRGLEALPQNIRTAIGLSKGEMLFRRELGLRSSELTNAMPGVDPADLLKSEIIRLAAIPMRRSNADGLFLQLRAVEKVEDVRMIGDPSSDARLDIEVQLRVKGYGVWKDNATVYQDNMKKE